MSNCQRTTDIHRQTDTDRQTQTDTDRQTQTGRHADRWTGGLLTAQWSSRQEVCTRRLQKLGSINELFVADQVATV